MSLDRRVIELYDEYTHAPLDRRVFLDRLSQMVGGAVAAAVALSQLEPGYAAAQTVAADDPAVVAQRVQVPGGPGSLVGYLAHPRADGRSGAVIVVHENRGLNPHIEDVTRRLAKAGFLALAPDFLSPLGGTPADADEARALFGRLPADGVDANMAAALRWLEAHPRGNGKVGTVGFCWGGGVVGRFATQAPGLDAGVVFYGVAPPSAAVAAVKSPLLLHYASLDQRINAGVPAFEAALKAASVPYEMHMYEGVDHAFHNDTAGPRYDAAAAMLAWERTLAFFRRHLS